MTYEQWRATFEDTLNYQEELRDILDEKQKNNSPIKPDERKNFFKLLGRSLLGLDFEKSADILFPDNSILHIDKVGMFIRNLAYLDDETVDKSFLKRYDKHNSISVHISFLWEEIKYILFGIYPEAQRMAVTMSKEREQRDFSSEGGFIFGGDKKKGKDSR